MVGIPALGPQQCLQSPAMNREDISPLLKFGSGKCSPPVDIGPQMNIPLYFNHDVSLGIQREFHRINGLWILPEVTMYGTNDK